MVCSLLRAISYVGLPRHCVRAPLGPWHHQVPRVPLPDIGVTFIRETCIASCEDITPRSWLLRTNAPIPLGSPLLRPKPRARSLCRLLPAPAAGGTIPTLSLRILPWVPGPLSRRYVECIYLFLPPRHRPSPVHYRGRLSRICPSKRILDGSHFRDCSHSFIFRPPSLLASQIVPTAATDRRRAAEAFTSEQNLLRFLRRHRTCLPSEYRQLMVWGLTPHGIHNLVGCSGEVRYCKRSEIYAHSHGSAKCRYREPCPATKFNIHHRSQQKAKNTGQIDNRADTCDPVHRNASLGEQ